MWHDWPIYLAVPYTGSKNFTLYWHALTPAKCNKTQKKERKYLSAFIANFCLVRASRLPASLLTRGGDGASTAGKEEAAAIVLSNKKARFGREGAIPPPCRGSARTGFVSLPSSRCAPVPQPWGSRPLTPRPRRGPFKGF